MSVRFAFTHSRALWCAALPSFPDPSIGHYLSLCSSPSLRSFPDFSLSSTPDLRTPLGLPVEQSLARHPKSALFLFVFAPSTWFFVPAATPSFPLSRVLVMMCSDFVFPQRTPGGNGRFRRKRLFPTALRAHALLAVHPAIFYFMFVATSLYHKL